MSEPAPRPLDTPELAAVVAAMRGCPAAWGIAGGWAIDLFLGRRTRTHADVDVAVFRAEQQLVREHFRGWEMRKAAGGELVPWSEGEWLAAPLHEVHARRSSGEPRAVELLLNERADDRWVYRRDPSNSLSLARTILRGGDDVPFFAPEIALLYKSKNPREHDERDFAAVLGSLGPGERSWLRNAISAVHPAHRWLARLERD